ncbi:MAG: methylmalonyl Co-A mutase-associated GTPase MeaB [bacterium]|nr:methylmalonyl Co-A mutase-associated GTPase MeaB [bacterium]MCP4798425.1 methylmalonyl Co-A mutase-associated GTPase MeaB [bacterium]
MTLEQLVTGIRSGNRSTLGRALTLVESGLPADKELAAELLNELASDCGQSIRIGITGVPGAGKSTFIDAFGSMLTAAGHKVAVLAVDPSSTISGGSILGDKTRMEQLAVDENAFIRPSPSSGTLGGVARRTREGMLLCEAAGYDVVLIETVGIGQSETVAAGMVDFFMALMITGAGDQLQGIKRGLMELVDMVVINKADGDNLQKANLAASEYKQALHYLSSSTEVPVLTCSALQRTGLEQVWEKISEHNKLNIDSGALENKRKQQQLKWMWDIVDAGLLDELRNNSTVKQLLPELEEKVLSGSLSATAAARVLLRSWTDH